LKGSHFLDVIKRLANLKQKVKLLPDFRGMFDLGIPQAGFLLARSHFQLPLDFVKLPLDRPIDLLQLTHCIELLLVYLPGRPEDNIPVLGQAQGLQIP
jgi:hypothetical protein